MGVESSVKKAPNCLAPNCPCAELSFAELTAPNCLSPNCLSPNCHSTPMPRDCNCDCNRKFIKHHSERSKALLIRSSVITDKQLSFHVLVKLRGETKKLQPLIEMIPTGWANKSKTPGLAIAVHIWGTTRRPWAAD